MWKKSIKCGSLVFQCSDVSHMQAMIGYKDNLGNYQPGCLRIYLKSNIAVDCEVAKDVSVINLMNTIQKEMGKFNWIFWRDIELNMYDYCTFFRIVDKGVAR